MANTASFFSTMFGDRLLSGSGEVQTASALKGKTVGIYFSAHWCGPCRGFTPKLVETYKTMKAAGKPFEIVFASSDRDEDAFKSYYGEMPWLALPFDEAGRAAKAKLSKTFKVQGIPTLVILDEQGAVITKDGREAIGEDPKGESFPWTPPTFWEALGETFVGQNGAEVSLDELKGKHLALYFSAHWCPPCRGFTPKLAATYKAMKASGRDDFEFIFVSSDRDEAAFKSYHAEHPWLALPFADRKRKGQLSNMFGVRGIPSLVVVDPSGNVVTTKARGAASADPTGAEFPWTPKPTVNLCEDPGDINEKASVVMLLSGIDASKHATAKAALEKVAVAKNAALKAAGKDTMCFFYAESDAGITAQVRGLVKVERKEGVVQLLVLDIPDDGAFYIGKESADIDEATLTEFVSQYERKEITRNQLSR